MVRTKSGEQAKRLAAKLAAAADTPPPPKPAKPKPSNLHFLGDPRPTGDSPAAESAEELARAEIIAQTRKGAVVAATLCRTNFAEGLQGTSQGVVDVLGEGGLVPRKGWLGGVVPAAVRESEPSTLLRVSLTGKGSVTVRRGPRFQTRTSLPAMSTPGSET